MLAFHQKSRNILVEEKFGSMSPEVLADDVGRCNRCVGRHLSKKFPLASQEAAMANKHSLSKFMHSGALLALLGLTGTLRAAEPSATEEAAMLIEPKELHSRLDDPSL